MQVEEYEVAKKMKELFRLANSLPCPFFFSKKILPNGPKIISEVVLVSLWCCFVETGH